MLVRICLRLSDIPDPCPRPRPNPAVGGLLRIREEEELLRLQLERQRLLDLAGAGPSLTAAATAAAFPFRAPPVRLKAADSRSGTLPPSSPPREELGGSPFEDPFASRPLAFPAAFSGFGKSLPSSFAYSTSSRSPSPFGPSVSRRRGRL